MRSIKYIFLFIIWTSCGQNDTATNEKLVGRSDSIYANSNDHNEKDLNLMLSDSLLMEEFKPIKLKDPVRYGYLANLKDRDTLKILYSTIGCFHSGTEILKIYQNGIDLMGELEIITISKKVTSNSQPKKLTDECLIRYGELEENGKLLKSKRFCTTEEYYVIVLNCDTLKFKNSDCTNFSAYHELKESIFDK